VYTQHTHRLNPIIIVYIIILYICIYTVAEWSGPEGITRLIATSTAVQQVCLRHVRRVDRSFIYVHHHGVSIILLCILYYSRCTTRRILYVYNIMCICNSLPLLLAIHRVLIWFDLCVRVASARVITRQPATRIIIIIILFSIGIPNLLHIYINII